MKYGKRLVIQDGAEERYITLYTDPNEVPVPRVVLESRDRIPLYASFAEINNILSSKLEVDINDEDYPKRVMKRMTHTVHIEQEPRETIIVTAEGKEHTEDFVIGHAERYTIRVEPVYGWDPGVVRPQSSGYATEDMDISVESASRAKFPVNIIQQRGQTIVVHYKGTDYTSSFTGTYEDPFTVTLSGGIYGFNKGTLLVSSGTIQGETTIEATPPTRVKYTVTITQSANQLISVTANGETYTSTFQAEYETPLTFHADGDFGYDPGTLNQADQLLTGNITVSATAATLKQYPIKITQKPNQTITVKSNKQTYTSDFIATHGTTYTAKIEAFNGYNSGFLSTTAGTFTEPINITATDAKLKTFRVNVNQSSHQTLVVNYNGRNYTESFVAAYGQPYTAQAISEPGWVPGQVSSSSGVITGKTTISVKAASPTYTSFLYLEPGNFSFTVPAGVKRIRVTIVGGGGGASVIRRNYAGNGDHPATSGETSFFIVNGTQYNCTGGGGGNCTGKYDHSNETYDIYSLTPVRGAAGKPAGRNGKNGDTGTESKKTINGGGGYRLSTVGIFGSGGGAHKVPTHVAFATGGGGGYKKFKVSVTEGETYTGYVGGGGNPYRGEKAGIALPGDHGGVFIEYGGGI